MLLNYANTLIVETNGLLYILCVFICKVIIIIIIIIIIYLFIYLRAIALPNHWAK